MIEPLCSCKHSNLQKWFYTHVPVCALPLNDVVLRPDLQCELWDLMNRCAPFPYLIWMFKARGCYTYRLKRPLRQIISGTGLQKLNMTTMTWTLPHLYNILLAGLVLRSPFCRASPQIHSDLWFGLTKLEGEMKRIKKGQVNTQVT